ncbi:DUF2812 domain-containing protein [Bacillus sp. es.036]|uniref:DUF2812 domain-containing protein n=1 Tax=Bacillus sp. es.036 TaxID=1761764 RepID=UPI000C01949B|nr:DUF2812 domain-containing protein [Bacillus sp. es.036]PFG12405.1 uncharacterized protein DUF2812 [Bacillus sp. es.036]
MGKTKYVMSSGLAFSEEKEMAKLSEYARKGWLFEKFAFLGFVLRQGEPQNLIYSLDYQKEPDEEYFSYFEEAGWTIVCSVGNEMHVFSAAQGTTPIYSDKESTKEKYERERQSMKKVASPALLLTLVFIVLSMSSQNGYLPSIVGQISEYSSYATFIVLIFTGMPYLAYCYKLKKLEKQDF